MLLVVITHLFSNETMSNFNNFAEMAIANGTQMNSRVIAMATDGAGVNTNAMPQAHFVQNTVTNNGMRAGFFHKKRNELLDGKGNIDPAELELSSRIEAEMGTWDADDIAAARRYLNTVLETTRWVGKPAKARAKELLEKLDAQPHQQIMPLDYGEDTSAAMEHQKAAEYRQSKGFEDHLKYPNDYDEKGKKIPYKQSPKAIQQLLWDVTKMTERFDEIKAMGDANNIDGLKSQMFNEMEYLDGIETRIKQAERRLSIAKEPYHKEGYQKTIDEAKVAAAKYQKVIDGWQKRIDAADAYNAS